VWLCLNKKALKNAVLSEVNAWINLFKNDLIFKVKNSLQVKNMISFHYLSIEIF